MRDPDGKDYPNRGVYLEVVENEQLVFTDAFTAAWEPSEKPFMTAIITFEDLATARRATPRAPATGRSRTAKPHEKMGFTRAGASAPTSSRNC